MIFSFAYQVIAAIGIFVSGAEDEPKPLSFGSAGDRWDKEGWMVKVKWVRLKTAIRPKDFINEIAPYLPEKYSPLRGDGNGNQGVYLTQVNSRFVDLLLRIITKADGDLPDELKEAENDVSDLEVEKQIIQSNLQKTERDQLIQARIGQGLFRGNVEKIESKCRVTGLSDKRLLVASHIKPWRVASNEERLDGNNGFLMSPHVDRLFDGGWISFADDGKILIGDRDIRSILSVWAIVVYREVGALSKNKNTYLENHRDGVLKRRFDRNHADWPYRL